MTEPQGFGIIRPDGPVIAVYKGWQDKNGLAHSSELRAPKSSGNHCLSHKSLEREPIRHERQFVFIDSGPSVPLKKTKRAIKIQVKKKDGRRKVRRNCPSNKQSQSTKSPSDPNDASASTIPRADSATARDQYLKVLYESDVHAAIGSSRLGYSTALAIYDYPIEMKPSIHRLLDRYLKVASRNLYPVGLPSRHNTIGIMDWFHYAVTDAATFQGLLYAGAVCLALLEDRSESAESIYHQNQTMSIVNRRLSNSTSHVEDSTIGAVSCLALGEALKGNLDLWKVHMSGLKQIINARGDLSTLHALLQIKLRRSDVTGAIDYGATPYLELHLTESPHVWSSVQKQKLDMIKQGLSEHTAPCSLDADLCAILTDLAFFSHSFLDPLFPIDSTAYLDDMYCIEHNLLSFPVGRDDTINHNPINQSFRLGGLLYIKALLQEFPNSKMGSSVLLIKLQDAIFGIPQDEPFLPLLVWLKVLGAGLLKPSERARFTCDLGRISRTLGLTSFKDSELAMSKHLSLERIFGSLLDTLWSDIRK